MRLRDFIVLYLTLFLIYIAGGDLFLPEPYRHNSKQVRNNINHYLISLFPDKKFTNFQHTNGKVKELEQGRVSSPLR